ncbi:glycosyltransferase [Clostridium saccharoperbutylacetonicum]|uniref:glycosyltransferase family protein n=1 Tax=Clostridium saccharoperbutylacetonicum TaxID=36745 RepID=UPI0009839442|nr:glycosyltransferase [Clostridium saccharoperbutylacetonicum]AQR96968.1 hypothetical protein CLSAP_42920 [Clostridium saccharoperbutylacetonicum]NSB32847.1 glycosyltransferase involved in cell wall biosynthesis [Clostridium saccharoperbutylacetonicum]
MARIILYKGQSQYGALGMHIDKLAQAFQNIGHMPIIIDFDKPTALNDLERELKIGCNFIFAINGVLSEFKIGEEFLCNILDVPYITLLVDHPIYHTARLDCDINKFIVTCLDYKHLDFLTEMYDKNHFMIKSFLVPGGSKSKLSREEDFEEFESNRNINLLFTGSFRGIPQREWEVNKNRTVANLMNDICDQVLANDYYLVEDAFEYVIKQRNLEFALEKRNNIKKYMVSTLTDYMASYKRYVCLETLVKEGVSIDLYGVGWSEWADNYKNIRYYGVGSVDDTLDLLTKTKLCLNINNGFAAGGHERVFNAMINGAPVISDKSLFYDKEFEEGKDIITYSWTDLSRLPEKVNNYLNNTEALWNISINARKKVQEKYTWEHKARQIIELFELSMM